MKILFTRQSERHLESIYQFYFLKNERIAANIYNQILDEIEFLKKQPYRAFPFLSRIGCSK